jgi:hypothetical protein
MICAVVHRPLGPIPTRRAGPRTGSPLTSRRVRTAAAVAAVSAVLAVAPASGAARAGASSLAVVAAGTVQAVSDPGATLAVAADGRINGYGFAGRLLGAAVGGRDPGAGIAAGPGQQLWVFGLAWTADVTASAAGNNQAVTPVTATVIYQGNRIPVPVSQPQPPSATAAGADPTKAQTGNEYFAASLPAAAGDVELEMASDGYTQDFSLTHMTRTGVQPAALYRNPDSWDTTISLDATKVLPTPYSYPPDGYNLPGAALQIQLPTVTVSYFGPDGASDPAPSSGQAWLIPDLADPFNPTGADPSDLLEYLTPPPPIRSPSPSPPPPRPPAPPAPRSVPKPCPAGPTPAMPDSAARTTCSPTSTRSPSPPP